jgi:predicted transcriptional regulator
MKSILMSIQPKWVEKIINGEKTIEVRKTAPKEVPFKVYVYCTKEKFRYTKEEIYANVNYDWADYYKLKGKVVAEFVCDYVEKEAVAFTEMGNLGRLYHCRLSLAELKKYAGKRTSLYYWHISALKVYDKPKELSDFRKPCIMSEMPYCPACKFGNIRYSSDEVECSRDIEGASCEWLCTNFVKRPPQSWQYVEEVEE